MRKLTSIFLTIVLAIGLTGCSNSTETKAIEQGKLFLAESEYDKALGSFELAINEGSQDAEVKNLIKIIEGYKESKKLIDEGKMEEAKQILDKIHQDYKKYSIKQDIDKLKETMNNYAKNNEYMTKKLESIDTLLGEGKYADSKVITDEILNSEVSMSELNKEKLSAQVITIDSELARLENERAIKEKSELEAKNDPHAWAPGIKEAFEADMRRDYIGPNEKLIYEKEGEYEPGEGRYAVYTMLNGEKTWLVGVNAKTGYYHG